MCSVLVWYLIIVGVSIRLVEGINCTNPDWLFYSGNGSITDGGRTCQLWTEHTPHQHWFDQGIYFPNDNNSVENAENYCRTPDANDVPWCLTTDPHKMYQNCNNRICGGPTCGGIQTNITGSFSSIDWDGDGYYDNENDCLWTLTAPEDMHIEVEILFMEIENEYACTFDFLEIYEQGFSHGRFCGQVPPLPVKSLGNVLYVRFYADNMVNGLGFSAIYSHIQREDNGTKGTNGSDPIPSDEVPDMYVGQVLCPPGTDLSLYAGNMSTTNGGWTCRPWAETSPFFHTLMGSHNYPIDRSVEAANNYCRNIHSSHIPWCFTMDIERPFQYCDERICDDVGQVLCPPGTDLSLYSGNVSITNGGRTCQPWADIASNVHNVMGSHNYPVDGSVEAANNYCRNVYSTHMPWCFTMDPDRPYQDCYERICDVGDPKCGGVVTAPNGSLMGIDRDQDGQYDIYRDCLWTLTAPAGMQIEVQVHSVAITYDNKCKIDAFSVYDVLGFNDGRVCGNVSSYIFRSKSNVALVRFVSNSVGKWPGFNLTFSHVERIETTTHTTEMPPGDSEGTLTVEPDHSSQTQPGLNASPTDGSTPHYQGTTENGCIRESLHCILIPFIVIFCDFSSAFLVC